MRWGRRSSSKLWVRPRTSSARWFRTTATIHPRALRTRKPLIKKPRCPFKPPLVTMYSSVSPGSRPRSAGGRSGGSSVSVAARKGMAELYQARFEGAEPDVKAKDGVVTIRYPRRLLGLGGQQRAAEVTLNVAIPWQIVIQGGASDVSAELGGLDLASLVVKGGLSSIRLELPVPSGVVPIRISGGASEIIMPDREDQPFEAYLRRIEALLADLPPERRTEIRRELIAHLEDAATEQDLSPTDPTLQEDVIAKLGASRDVAAALGEVHGRPYRAYRRRAFVAGVSGGLIVAITSLLLVWYELTYQGNRPPALVFTLLAAGTLGVGGTLLHSMGHRASRLIVWSCAVVAMVGGILALWSVGIFYLIGAFLMLVGATAGERAAVAREAAREVAQDGAQKRASRRIGVMVGLCLLALIGAYGAIFTNVLNRTPEAAVLRGIHDAAGPVRLVAGPVVGEGQIFFFIYPHEQGYQVSGSAYVAYERGGWGTRMSSFSAGPIRSDRQPVDIELRVVTARVPSASPSHLAIFGWSRDPTAVEALVQLDDGRQFRTPIDQQMFQLVLPVGSAEAAVQRIELRDIAGRMLHSCERFGDTNCMISP